VSRGGAEDHSGGLSHASGQTPRARPTTPGLLSVAPCAGRRAPVLVQARERVEVLAGDAGRVLHGDERVGVAGVAHHHDLDVRRGHLVERLALVLEDATVEVQQVGALHAGAARLRAHHQRPVRALEDLARVGADGHLPQQGVEGVLQLHGDALEGLAGALAAQQLQRHGLVAPKHLAW